MGHISLRIPDEELERWRQHAGREPLGAWVKRMVAAAIDAEHETNTLFPVDTAGRVTTFGHDSRERDRAHNPDVRP